MLWKMSREEIENYEKKYYSMTASEIGTDYNFKRKIVWWNAIGFFLLHVAFLIGFCLIYYSHFFTLVFALGLSLVSGFGITIGAHRLFAHKSFKAPWFVRLVLVILHTIAGQNCMYVWVREHRLHHKYSDTDADPHNANRGFFFSHIGWLMSKKHPAVIGKGRTIDMSDIEADPIIMFQKEYYKALYIVCAIALPVATPVYFWNESYWYAIFVSFFFRYILTLNFTWLVNSAAHLYGSKPFDGTMSPVENWVVAVLALGEGWHNYHHCFPWDYRAAEFGSRYSPSTFIINILASIGLVYDLRVAPYRMVEHHIKNKGDGSHHIFGDMTSITYDQLHDETVDIKPIQIKKSPLYQRLDAKG